MKQSIVRIFDAVFSFNVKMLAKARTNFYAVSTLREFRRPCPRYDFAARLCHAEKAICFYETAVFYTEFDLIRNMFAAFRVYLKVYTVVFFRYTQPDA